MMDVVLVISLGGNVMLWIIIVIFQNQLNRAQAKSAAYRGALNDREREIADAVLSKFD